MKLKPRFGVNKSFWALKRLIEGHPAFKSKSKKPQSSVALQLAAIPNHYGRADASWCQPEFNIGLSMGTIGDCRDRVVDAICEHYNRLIPWRSAQLKAETKKMLGRSGFAQCIGAVDGKVVPLSERPRDVYVGASYYCRKQFFAVCWSTVKKFPVAEIPAVCRSLSRLLQILSGRFCTLNPVIQAASMMWSFAKPSEIWQYRAKSSMGFSRSICSETKDTP